MIALGTRRLCALLLAAFIAGQAVPARATDAAAAAQDAALHALFDERWEDLMQSYPEWATGVGDHRYGDRLVDASAEAEAARFAATQRTLDRAMAQIPRGLRR